MSNESALLFERQTFDDATNKYNLYGWSASIEVAKRISSTKYQERIAALLFVDLCAQLRKAYKATIKVDTSFHFKWIRLEDGKIIKNEERSDK